jgi:integrase
MFTTSKSPRKVALVPVELARRALPDYAHRFSPRKFTQPQLVACPKPGAETTAAEKHLYVYDGWNRLVKVYEDKDTDDVRDADELRATYGYDGLHRRIRKEVDTAGTVDVHCLRHTFATLLARSGVSPGVAQKLMRHSDIRLTMNTYTHLDLADTAGAVAALPAI